MPYVRSSVVATLAVLVASAQVVAPGARASHVPPPGPQRAGDFTCRASGLRVGSVEPVVANDGSSPCVTDDGLFADIVAGPVTANVLHANTKVTLGNDPSGTQATRDVDPAPGDTAAAKAGVAFADVNLPGLHVVANVLEARAIAVCETVGAPPADSPVLRASSDVASISINGTVFAVPPGHEDVVYPGLATIHLNEVINGTNSITARALWIEPTDAGVGDVVVGEATAGFVTSDAGDDPCTSVVTAQCSAAAGETDPHVDPTSEATAGVHPDCATFDAPAGEGRDEVHFDRHITDADTSPNGSFAADNTDPDGRDDFYGEAGLSDGEGAPTLDGDIYDDEDLRLRLAPLTIDAYLAPNGDATSPWRRFCGTGLVEMHGGMPAEPFALGQVRSFVIETYDGDFPSGGSDAATATDGSFDYFVVDIFATGSTFDTHRCDQNVADIDHTASGLDYHSEGRVIAGNIHLHSERAMPQSPPPPTS